MGYACIFVPDFMVQAILRAQPDLRSQAVAVLEGKPPLERVVALNEKARRTGIELGMTKLQAEACPELMLRLRSRLEETTTHAALLDCAQSFSPRVEDTAIDTVIIDLAGMQSLFGEPGKLARGLADRASELGLETNVAVASNPDAAMLAARGFAGVTVVAEGEEQRHLGSLPLHLLFTRRAEENAHAGNEFLETVERWGVRDFRAFAALPEIAVSERLGQRGVYWQKLARGTVSRTIVPIDRPLAFEEVIELEYPLVLLEPLSFVLGRLLDQLCLRLAARALATQELRLKFELEPGAYPMAVSGENSVFANEDKSESSDSACNLFRRTLRLPLPMLDARVFLKLWQLDLKAHPPGAPIKKIWLAAEPARLRARQSGLFVPPAPEAEKLELTLARLTGIVGEGRAGSLEILDTHRPQTFYLEHFTVQAPGLKSRATREIGTVGLEPRASQNHGASREAVTALRIFRPPLNVTVTLRDGKPARMVGSNKNSEKKQVQGDIIWHAGPWRSSGDWWEQEPWARDEWDIALQNANSIILYRLVHDLLSGKWLIEGTYD